MVISRELRLPHKRYFQTWDGSMWRSALVIQYTTWCPDGCAHNAMPICKGIVSVSTMLFPVPFYFPWFSPVDSWLVHPSQAAMLSAYASRVFLARLCSLFVLISNRNVVPCHIWIDLKLLLSCNGVSKLAAIFDPTLHTPSVTQFWKSSRVKTIL